MVHLISSLMVGLGRNRVFGMLLCPKWPANQCKPVQQSRQLRPYCPDIYCAPCTLLRGTEYDSSFTKMNQICSLVVSEKPGFQTIE